MSSQLKSRSGQPSLEPVALVTGSARRIGACIATTLHQRGCRILLHYHASAEPAMELAARFNAERAGSAVLVQADLVAEDGPQALAEQVRAETTHLDVLVNNASRFYPTPVGGADDPPVSGDVWKDLMGSNLRGPFFLSQALIPELRAAQGAIVNIVDIHAERPMRKHTVYCIAKAGLAMMTRSLARELGPDIRVNGVAPGAILWPEDEPSAETKEHILSRTALKAMGHPQDIADAVAFLALDSPYITGQILAVDGGRSIIP